LKVFYPKRKSGKQPLGRSAFARFLAIEQAKALRPVM